MTTAAVLVVAMLLDAIMGEPKWLWSRVPHPAVAMGRLLDFLDQRLNKGRNRKAKGVICLLVLVLVGAALGTALGTLGALVEIICVAILIAQRSLVEHVQAVAAGLRVDIKQGRTAVAMIVSRETAQMDESQIARAAVESGAENLSDGVIAPAFWFLIAGLPGVIIYKFVNTADSMIGYRTEKYEAFGWAAARCDDLLNLIPARLTALLIALPSWQLDAASIRADALLHRSPNAGWPEAAMSRALGIALSGPRTYDGITRQFSWVNAAGRRALTAQDIDTSVTMLWKAWGLMFGLVAFVAFLAA